MATYLGEACPPELAFSHFRGSKLSKISLEGHNSNHNKVSIENETKN